MPNIKIMTSLNVVFRLLLPLLASSVYKLLGTVTELQGKCFVTKS